MVGLRGLVLNTPLKRICVRRVLPVPCKAYVLSHWGASICEVMILRTTKLIRVTMHVVNSLSHCGTHLSRNAEIGAVGTVVKMIFNDDEKVSASLWILDNFILFSMCASLSLSLSLSLPCSRAGPIPDRGGAAQPQLWHRGPLNHTPSGQDVNCWKFLSTRPLDISRMQGVIPKLVELLKSQDMQVWVHNTAPPPVTHGRVVFSSFWALVPRCVCACASCL